MACPVDEVPAGHARNLNAVADCCRLASPMVPTVRYGVQDGSEPPVDQHSDTGPRDERGLYVDNRVSGPHEGGDRTDRRCMRSSRCGLRRSVQQPLRTSLMVS